MNVFALFFLLKSFCFFLEAAASFGDFQDSLSKLKALLWRPGLISRGFSKATQFVFSSDL